MLQNKNGSLFSTLTKHADFVKTVHVIRLMLHSIQMSRLHEDHKMDDVLFYRADWWLKRRCWEQSFVAVHSAHSLHQMICLVHQGFSQPLQCRVDHRSSCESVNYHLLLLVNMLLYNNKSSIEHIPHAQNLKLGSYM